MRQLLLALEIVAGVSLIALILLQAKGSGLSAVFGGEGGVYRSRRGVEKLMHRTTILISFIFISLAVANLLIK